MKRTLIAALSATLVFLSAPVSADNHEDERDWFPMEIFACNFNEGKSMDDFRAATDAWSVWADERNVDTYWAGVLTPYYYGPAQGAFDVGWLGGWTSGTAMGTDTDLWLGEGGDVAAMFDDAATCEAHGGFVATQLYEGSGPDEDNNIVLSFQDCEISADPVPAFEAWAEYAAEAGFDGSLWMLFPVYGDGSADYGFKLLTSNHDFSELGTDWDLWEAHYGKWEELMGGTIECDDARVYLTSVERRPPSAED